VLGVMVASSGEAKVAGAGAGVVLAVGASAVEVTAEVAEVTEVAGME
jgi:hypothetical protein